jgi:lysophospholipase L1-like esterase
MTARVLLVAAGVGFAALVLEIALRVVPLAAVEVHRRAPAASEHAVFFQYDAALGWRGRPHARGPFAGWEFTSEVALNARGFRDRDPGPKPPGAHRLLVLGDSIAWGYGVEAPERFADRLPALLAARGRAVDVVNLAVSGYGTDQEYLLFRAEGAAYCPDVVLVGLYANDVLENAAATQGRYPKPYFETAAGGDLRLANVPVPRVDWTAPAPEAGGIRTALRRDLRLYAALAALRESARRWSSGAAAHPAPPAPAAAGAELTGRLLARLDEEARRAGARILVVALPAAAGMPGLGAVAARAGVPALLDLPERFRAAAGERLYYRLDGDHWTPAAHRLAAEGIADALARGPWLAAPPRRCEGG